MAQRRRDGLLANRAQVLFQELPESFVASSLDQVEYVGTLYLLCVCVCVCVSFLAQQQETYSAFTNTNEEKARQRGRRENWLESAAGCGLVFQYGLE